MYFKYDVKIGSGKTIVYILPVAVAVIGSCAVLYVGALNESEADVYSARALNSMDFFLYVFRGMEVFDRLSGEKFELPITWYLINMLLFYLAGKYPYSELNNNHGINILLLGGSRGRWYVSKWLWCMLCAVIYYAAAYAFVTVFCVATHTPLDFVIAPITYHSLLSPLYECGMADTLKVFVLPVITSMGAVSLQLFVSLIFTPLMGFLFMAVLYVSSAYYFTPFLIGNCSMLARSDIFIYNGISFAQAAGVSCAIAILSLVAGILFFGKKDIL